MSAPDQYVQLIVPLSTVPGVSVTEGAINLFAMDETGRRWPFLTVQGPTLIIGPTAGQVEITAVAHGTAAMATLSSDPSPQDLAPFVAQLAQRSPADAASISSLSAADLRDYLAKEAQQCISEGIAGQEQLTTDVVAVNAKFDRQTVNRLSSSVADPMLVSKKRRAFPSPYSEVNALRAVGNAGGFRINEPPELKISGAEAVMKIASESGLRSRIVHLGPGWTKSATSPLVGFITEPDGTTFAVPLLQVRGGFSYHHPIDAPVRKVVEGQTPLEPEAIMVYPSLPQDRPATLRDLGRIALRGTRSVVLITVLCSVAVALLSLATPSLTNAVLGTFVAQGAIRDIVVVGILLTLIAVSAGAFVVVQNFATSRLTQLAQMRVEAALWDRTLTLPLRFFRRYSSGDLSFRIIAIDNLKQLLSSQTVTSVLAAVFSLVNFVLLFRYSVGLALAAAVIFVITLVFIVWLTRRISTLIRGANASQQDTNAWFVQIVSGITKIRVAGAERRFTDISLLKQATQISNQAAQTILSGRLQTYLALISALSGVAFFYIIGVATWDNGPSISTTTYIAFSTAFGTVLGAVVGLASAVPALASAGPILELVRPIIGSVQEQDLDAETLDVLHGNYEFKDVSFKYDDGMPLVLSGLNMVIEAGKVTAIVGPSGSGKTSAIRLLSALEYPSSGQLLVDGRDIRSVDAHSLRSKLGVVVQGGMLANGSILDNIGGGVEISEDVAWNAAKQANIADDINAMPMKMHTIVSPLTLSGGQAQRVLVARALAKNPEVLLLDEATSALDNVSQAVITEVLSTMKITQIMIAQRLSTLQNADKIYVMDRGQVVEEGTFDTLLAAGGLFADLARRQLVDS